MKSTWSYRLTCLVVGLLLATLPADAQGWQRSFADLSQPYAVAPTPDGGAVFIATMQGSVLTDRDLVVVKTDADGRVQWQNAFGGPGNDEGRSLSLTADQQAIVVTARKSFVANNGDVWLAKLTLDGTQLWERTFNYGVLDEPCCVRPTPDGGYVVALEADNQLRLLKTDADGNETWTLPYPQTLDQTVEHLEITPDGGYLVTLLRSNPPILTPVATVLKTDAAGAVVFENSFQHLTSYGTTEIARAKPLPNGEYLLVHRDSVYHLDAGGQLLSLFQIAAPNTFYATDFVPAPDGGLWVLGTDYSYLPPPSSRLLLARLGPAGAPMWSHSLPIPNYAHSTWAAAQHADGGFLLTGNFQHNGDYFSYLLRTDSSGQIFSNEIAGQVFWDKNPDCAPAGDEPPLPGWLVKIIHPNGEVHYASTDSLGYYTAPAGLGVYTVSVVAPNSLWMAACEPGISVQFDTTFAQTTASFPVASTADCPLTWVDVGIAGWLPCMENALVVYFANQGTALAPAAEVELRLDSLLSVTGASIPYVQAGPFSYLFQLGDLAALQNGTFTVQVVPACGQLDPGQTKCVTARIRPDAPCLAPLDGPLIVVEGRCDADSVRFRVQNLGADMSAPLEFVIIEGDIMFFQGEFLVLNNGEQTYTLPSNGSTWRFEAWQAPGTPDWQSDTHVAAVVEGCSASGAFSTGFVNQFSLFDGGNFDETECREVIGAPGGLAKVAYPGGYFAEHFIAANTDLEYVLHFQNTGADTAEFVLLRDTLDAALLDVATVQPGPASHPYVFSVQDAGILTFRFDSIALPPGATGWVKFRVSQQPDLPNGVVIYNRASAGFGYGAPMLTNETFHTVTAPLLSAVNEVWPSPVLPTLAVWPVPATDAVWVELPRAGRYRAELRDAQGRLLSVQHFTEPRLRLPLVDQSTGVFVLTVWAGSQRIGTAQIIKN